MPSLSTPLVVKGFHLPGRLVMAPMVTGLAPDHVPTDRQVAWYAERAATGLGLVIVESTAVDAGALLLPYMLGAWDDAHAVGLARIAGAIKAHGVPAVVQLVHGGARSWRPDNDSARIGPSPVAVLPGPPPRAITEVEIAAVIDGFAAAAQRAVAAGFDGVEVHAAHYYLLSEFLSPRTNQRTDRWGGDLTGRARLTLEVVRAVRQAIGSEAMLLVRMHAIERVDGGLSSEDAVTLAAMLEGEGVDIVDASGIGQSSLGVWEGVPYLATSSALPKDVPAGFYVPYAARLRQAVTVPVIAVGKLGEPGLAQRVLDAAYCDLVALGRQLIADPQAAAKILAGRDEDVVRCEECFACFTSIRTGPIRCAVNRSL